MKRSLGIAIFLTALVLPCVAQRSPNPDAVQVDYRLFPADGGSELYIWAYSENAKANGFFVLVSYSAGFQVETVTRMVKRVGGGQQTSLKYFLPVPVKSVRVKAIQVVPVTAFDSEAFVVEPSYRGDDKPVE